jgi:hypothetical protein
MNACRSNIHFDYVNSGSDFRQSNIVDYLKPDVPVWALLLLTWFAYNYRLSTCWLIVLKDAYIVQYRILPMKNEVTVWPKVILFGKVNKVFFQI